MTRGESLTKSRWEPKGGKNIICEAMEEISWSTKDEEMAKKKKEDEEMAKCTWEFICEK